ncbi:MAG: site-specific integrase, partial [Porticoccus sp.]
MAISSSDQQLIDTYLDAVWMEKGLSQNTLDAYRRDLHAFGGWLSSVSQTLVGACGPDVQRYLAHRFEEGVAARSTARQL